MEQPWKYKAAAKLISNQTLSIYLNCSLKKCISRYNWLKTELKKLPKPEPDNSEPGSDDFKSESESEPESDNLNLILI